MTERRLAALVLKIWGVFWIVTALASLPQIAYGFASRRPYADWRWTTTFGVVVTLAIGLLMIKASDRIAAWIVAENDVVSSYPIVALEQAAFGVLGAYLLIRALREMADLAFIMVTKPAFDESDSLSYLLANGGRSVPGAIIQGVFAFALLLGRRGLARLWLKVHPMASDEQ